MFAARGQRIVISGAAAARFAAMDDYRFKLSGWALEWVELAQSLGRRTLPWRTPSEFVVGASRERTIEIMNGASA